MNIQKSERTSPALILATLGVVYGDIGTSPLYAFKECFNPEHGIPLTNLNVLGIVSLIFWTLTIIVSIKYVLLIMRVDNHGEGGIFALVSLALRTCKKDVASKSAIIFIGIFGAAMFYGDSIITPAISVLSAVEGLKIAAPALGEHTVIFTLIILACLFKLQKKGTGQVGKLFGPIILFWFLVIGAFGLLHIMQYSAILNALNPLIALQFFFNNGWISFQVLGAVFLAVTGAEALYADIGHFGVNPIRISWFSIAMPCLVLNYFGQGALVLHQPSAISDPFYLMVPPSALLPMVILSTLATIIASQAVITGAFSLTNQAIKLSYCPRMRVKHTSSSEEGQIYIPFINWSLFLAIAALVAYFESSSQLANAYGIAVSLTMIITTLLSSMVAHRIWKWSLVMVSLSLGVLFLIDLTFVLSNSTKIINGGWVTLFIGLCCCILMDTWKRGVQSIKKYIENNSQTLSTFLTQLERHRFQLIPGTAVFMSHNITRLPEALVHHLRHNKVLHERLIFLTITHLGRPVISLRNRIKIYELAPGVLQIKARYGFIEDANVQDIIEQCQKQHQLIIDIKDDTTFFVARHTIVENKMSGMGWQTGLFALMMRNTVGATDYFKIPSSNVIELGTQIEV